MVGQKCYIFLTDTVTKCPCAGGVHCTNCPLQEVSVCRRFNCIMLHTQSFLAIYSKGEVFCPRAQFNFCCLCKKKKLDEYKTVSWCVPHSNSFSKFPMSTPIFFTRECPLLLGSSPTLGFHVVPLARFFFMAVPLFSQHYLIT